MPRWTANPGVIVRCSSEFPFYPGAHQVIEWVNEGKFGRIIEVEAGFWHSSDLDPDEADQLEEENRDERRIWLHGRSGHARAASAHAFRLATEHAYGRFSARSWRSVRTARRSGPLRNMG